MDFFNESKTYNTMISKDYCPDWTASDAIREFVTNALDSTAPFKFEFGETSLTLTSEGITLPSSVLALGVSKNRDLEDSVGTHGEGMVVAMAVGLREGLGIEFSNGDVCWRPDLEYNSDFDTYMLIIHQIISPLPSSGFVVHITDISEEVMSQVKERCLYFREDVKNTLEGASGTLIKDFGGQIFVGGIYVCAEPTLKYSYDFKPNVLKLNRDRKSVDNWDLKWETSRLVGQVMDNVDIAKEIKANTTDVQYGLHQYSNKVKDQCANGFLLDNKGCIVASSEEEKEELREKYDAKPVVICNSTHREMITGSTVYRTYLESIELANCIEIEQTPVELLQELLENIPNGACDGVVIGALEGIISQYEERGVIWDE